MFQSETTTSQTGFDRSRMRWLLLVLFVALGLRVAWLTIFTKAINGEGAEYARIAENLVAGRGYVGIAMEGVELMFPPLFPLMIAAGSYVVGSSYLAAQLIALAAGVVLLLLVFGIVRDLYNENTALVAVGVAALHPILIKLSGTSWVEGPYIALLMASVYFMNRARRSPEYRSWSLAGVCAGLAYLTSPQALLLPFVFLISQLLVRQNRKLVTFGKVAVLVGSFVVLALPYVAFLSTSTGTLRLEGKTIVNNELGARLLSGLSDCVAGYEVTENLDAKGVWMRPNADVAKSAGPPNYRTTLGIMFSRKGFHNIGVVGKEISTGLFFGAPLITLLAFLGLLRTPWSANRASGEILLLLTVLGSLVPLMTQIHMFQERYYFFLVPFLVIWAANGIAEITQWSRETLTKLGTTFPSPRIGGALAGGLALGGLLALMAGGFNGIGTFIGDAGPRARAVRNAGDWLASIPGDKIVMDTDTPLAFHAGARYVPMPCCDSATALRFGEKKNVNFIVLKIWTLGQRSYLQDWWSRGVPSPKSTLVYSAGSNPDVRILIFRLELAGAPTPARRAADSSLGHAADGPLHPSPTNPRYFGGRNGRPVYLAGSHTWANFQDRGSTEPLVPFDYEDYLDFLDRFGLNFFRLWTWENAKWAPWTNSDFFFNPMPFERTGPGFALDGKPRFDLTRFNRLYFERLRSRVKKAGDRGIYVSVMLFNGFSVERKGKGLGNPWSGHPLNGKNNVNGVDGDQNGNGEGEEVHTLQVSDVLRVQENYVKAVVDAVNDLNNVIFEISNESHAGSVAWQYHMIEFIKAYESTKPKQHSVGMTSIFPQGDNGDLFRSPGDWVSPNRGNADYLSSPPVAVGEKVVVSDTDHLCGECGDRSWVWKSLTRGLNPLYMDGFKEKNFSDPVAFDIRRNLGFSRGLATRIDLASALPSEKLSSTGYCLASLVPGRAEYLVYVPSAGGWFRRLRIPLLNHLFDDHEAFAVDLSATPTTLRVEWLDPATGESHDSGEVSGGARHTFRVPFAGDAVLFLRDARLPPDTDRRSTGVRY